jgi:prepilin-type N-terminal cleavage/methylation domain-containing protein
MRLTGVRSDKGLTLIETMVALTIFAIFTVGVAPLLASALKGAALSRSYTVGRTLASGAMERARGLPYFVSVQGTIPPARRDLLDLYFPDRNTGFSATGANANTFTTTCTATSSTPAASGALACPKNIPTNYTVTFVAAFVSPGPTSPTPQTFEVVPPGASYDWDTVGSEQAPSNLLRMTINVSWLYGGETQNYSLTSLLGQRELNAETISSTGKLDYAVRVLSSYTDSSGQRSNLVATAGKSESDIVTIGISEASEETLAGQMVLTQEAVGETSAVTLADLSGASSFVHAPPNAYPAAGSTAGDLTVSHQYSASTSVPIAFMDDSAVETPTGYSLGAQVVNELPRGAGKFRFSQPAGANQPTMWIDNQADRGLASPLKLDDSAHLVTLERDGATPRLNGQTSAEATALSPTASRKVEAKASAAFSKLSIFPTTFITDPDDSVLVIDNFTASLTCTSTASATAEVLGTWSATLRYWRDLNNNGLTDGGYEDVPLTGDLTGGIDPLATLKSTGNPLVYDDLVDANDLYLFQTADRNGYFTDLRGRRLIASSEAGSGRSTTGSLEEAINIETVATSATDPATTMSLSVGSLSCRAVDKRGL